ncbi:hypothetical protein C9J01_03650 [Photobacterium rosenbergii]|uniref:Uncharacterized protein n=1 Tax=Photobacterium rosenbergii TaxID=294936 RepID=A0A2T3NKV4_9GAMM|nr:hypothetical protein [Photobacterium rosenbergii]PSW16110.1 hypothetical protein C9J01_03650 [Photobacterium rosenbergii]
MDVEIHLQGDVFEVYAENLCSVTLVGSEERQTTLILIGEPELSAKMDNDLVVQQFYLSNFTNSTFVNVSLTANEPTELLFESKANIDANWNVYYDLTKLEVLSLNDDKSNCPIRIDQVRKKPDTARLLVEHQAY